MVIFQKPHINYGIQQLVLILNHSFKNQTQVYQKQELRSKPDLWQKLLIWFGFITKLCKLLKLFNYCLFCFSLLCFCAPLIAEKWKNFRLGFKLKWKKKDEMVYWVVRLCSITFFSYLLLLFLVEVAGASLLAFDCCCLMLWFRVFEGKEGVRITVVLCL